MRGLPGFVKDEVKLARLRRRHRKVDYIRSPAVSLDAELGVMVEISDQVLVNAGVSIGDYSYVNRGALIFSGTIGKFCSIAHHVQIGAEQHPVRHLSTSPWIYSDTGITGQPSGFDEFPSPPVIGSDVWIGSSAIVMQGVTICHGAIVAAGAVVTKDVAPYSIVAGVPAKPIGSRFDEATVERLLKWAWWDLPIEEIKALGPVTSAGEAWADRM